MSDRPASNLPPSAASPSTSSPTAAPFRFLDLPPEIRELVYGHVLHPARNRVKDQDSYVHYAFDLALFRVSRLLYNEARPIFFRLNTFVAIETPWAETQEHVEKQGYVPVVVHIGDAAADGFTHHSLLVSIDAPLLTGNISSGHHRPCRMIIHVDDLSAFAEFWMYQDLSFRNLNQHMRLKLKLRNPHQRRFESVSTRTQQATNIDEREGLEAANKAGCDERADLEAAEKAGCGMREEGKRDCNSSTNEDDDVDAKCPLPEPLQRRLLEPFGVLRGLFGLQITGVHSAEIETALRQAMERPYRSPEDCLDEAATLKEEGNKALNEGRFRDAITLYENSFRALHIVCDGRRRSVFGGAHFDGEMRSGRFKGSNGAMTRLIMRVRLVSSIVYAFLKLGEFEWARFWGQRTISLFRAEIEDGGGHDHGAGIGADDDDDNAEQQQQQTGGQQGQQGATSQQREEEEEEEEEEIDEGLLDFPASNELGKIYYRTGVAYKHLGNASKARSLLKVAMAYLPQDPQVRQEYATVSLRNR